MSVRTIIIETTDNWVFTGLVKRLRGAPKCWIPSFYSAWCRKWWHRQLSDAPSENLVGTQTTSSERGSSASFTWMRMHVIRYANLWTRPHHVECVSNPITIKALLLPFWYLTKVLPSLQSTMQQRGNILKFWSMVSYHLWVDLARINCVNASSPFQLKCAMCHRIFMVLLLKNVILNLQMT